MSYEQNFLALANEIPPIAPSVPAGCNFVLSRQVGKLLILSGYGPFWGASVPPKYTGKLGGTISVAQGYAASQLTGINLLLMARQAIGTLDNVAQIIEINGMVNCTPDFRNSPMV